MSGFDSSFLAAAVAAAVTERALARLLRGTTWQAITREITWRAVVESGADGDLIEAMTGFADASLSELADGSSAASTQPPSAPGAPSCAGGLTITPVLS